MLVTTKLTCTDNLPLTCSRSGTCCHGKTVRLNPWELACLAEAKELTPRAFRDRYCDFGGIDLRFDGAPGWKQQPGCSQYVNFNSFPVAEIRAARVWAWPRKTGS